MQICGSAEQAALTGVSSRALDFPGPERQRSFMQSNRKAINSGPKAAFPDARLCEFVSRSIGIEALGEALPVDAEAQERK